MPGFDVVKLLMFTSVLPGWHAGVYVNQVVLLCFFRLNTIIVNICHCDKLYFLYFCALNKIVVIVEYK